MDAFGHSARFLVLTAALALISGDANAGCCTLRKIDAETASVLVRACEPDPDGACGNLLFLGTLSVGDGQFLCGESDTLVYQEWDADLEAYGPPTEAVCTGRDVEI